MGMFGDTEGIGTKIVNYARLAAGSIYHEISVIESDVTSWTHDHPEVQPLINEAIGFVESLLAADGMDVAKIGQVLTIGKVVVASLKTLAVSDPGVVGGVVQATKEQDEQRDEDSRERAVPIGVTGPVGPTTEQPAPHQEPLTDRVPGVGDPKPVVTQDSPSATPDTNTPAPPALPSGPNVESSAAPASTPA